MRLLLALLLCLMTPAYAQQATIPTPPSLTTCLTDYTTNTAVVNTTSATDVMSGYGATYTCTPTGSKLLVTATVVAFDTNAAGQNLDLNLRYGTGAAPAAGAAASGTACGRAFSGGALLNYGHSVKFPVTLTCYLTGLTPGTALWFDWLKNSPDGVSTVGTLSPTIAIFNVN